MSWDNLKTAIADVIKTNGNQEITGYLLQQELFRIVDQLGASFGYLGIAIPTTDPGVQDGNVFYFAKTAGTYVNFDNIELTDGKLYILSKMNGAWSSTVLLDFDLAEVSEAIRKSVRPSSYVSYLPEGQDYTTPQLQAGVYTKILIPTTIKEARDFAIVDKGGGNFAVQYQGTSARTFKVFMSSSIKASTNNIVFSLYMYRNGVVEPGITIDRKISSGADVGSMATLGEFTAQPNDFIEIYVESDLASTITFIKTSIIITEKN